MSVHTQAMSMLLAGLDRPVIQNAVHSMYVEYQVAVLLGDQWQLVGTDRGGWDFESTTGHRLELKQAIAARVQARAEPGEILVSETLRDVLLGSNFVFEDRGEHDLKGLDRPRRLYAVTDTSDRPA